MSEISFWLPLFLIFASAVLAAVIKRNTKDPCLRVFHGCFVHLKLKDGRWISGDLVVYSNSLELIYREPSPMGLGFERLSHVLYEENLDSIDRLLRPSPREGTPTRAEWEREIFRLRHPSVLRVVRRRFRNVFNMLRDAVAQAIVIIFGTVRRRTRLAAVPLDETKVGEMGRTLISAVPNAYEPVLEKYLGRQVAVETTSQAGPYEQTGLLQEYSARYILARDVDLLREAPPDCGNEFAHQFDVIFPRPLNVVRHLARKDGA